MAQMESWEAATEFGIPEAEWARYDVRRRTDDVYIACLASVFDALRIEKVDKREAQLAALAKTLVLYSRSSAAKYLSGVERRLNQVYSAALYYLAGLPATAILLARNLDAFEDTVDEESFLYGFLGRRLTNGTQMARTLSEILHNGETDRLSILTERLQEEATFGLKGDPRKFIAARLALSCLLRFSENNVWQILKQHAAHYNTELWQPFLGNMTVFPLWEVLPSQLVAIQAGLLGDTDETFSLQMPTSAGKTALCELLIYHEVRARNRRVLFLVPFRALAAEVRDGMSRRLSDAGVRMVATHGGNIPTRSETANVEDADALIVTPEKFVALTQVVPDLETLYQTIICDEGQLIDDNTRGLQYELLLTKLRGSAAGARKFIFMSAILPNVNEIHEWLGGQPEHLARSAYRPVELDYAFLEPRPSDTWRLEVNPMYEQPRSYFLVRFLTKEDFRYVNPATGRLKLIDGWKSYLSLAAASALKARRSGPVAVFTTSRGERGIQGLADALLRLCESKALVAQNAPGLSYRMPDLLEYISFLFGDDYSLARLLSYGAGFHHGMLPQEVRRVMEESIQNGTINLLLCTNTLAEGVNLPIRTLVVHTVRRYDPEAERLIYLPNRNIKNIIGRAGRAGKETRGRVLFVTDSERSQIESLLRDEGMESAHGALYRLIEAINNFTSRNHIPLQNETFDRQQPWFLALIDSIDFALLDLIPAGTPQEEVDRHITGLLDRTLASRYCSTAEMCTCLETVFRLRAEHLKRTVTHETWPVLRKTGASPRLWNFVTSTEILEHPLWQSLTEALDDEWITTVISRLLEFPGMEIGGDREIMQRAIIGWMSGLTYSELSKVCECEIDAVLELICRDVGYRLQDLAAKVCQLAIERYGEADISETARNWSSLLQFGLGTMQQLDLFERGCSERAAVWGVSRYLADEGLDIRGRRLIRHLRRNSEEVRRTLKRDGRVPKISFDRFCEELRIW